MITLMNEQKILLQDLCARLPYDVKVWVKTHHGQIIESDILTLCNGGGYYSTLTYEGILNDSVVKPYLRPLSAITEEEKFELQKAFNIKSSIIGEYGISSDNAWWAKGRKEPLGFDTIRYTSFCGVTDYLNSIHVDYRGLIPMGLALKAPEGMYN
jgi:hypothetical protein